MILFKDKNRTEYRSLIQATSLTHSFQNGASMSKTKSHHINHIAQISDYSNALSFLLMQPTTRTTFLLMTIISAYFETLKYKHGEAIHG